MNPISMALGVGRTDAISRVMMDASARMTHTAENMLRAGHELALIGKEMGKGQLLDVMA